MFCMRRICPKWVGNILKVGLYSLKRVCAVSSGLVLSTVAVSSWFF